jgi:hypothetical protein
MPQSDELGAMPQSMRVEVVSWMQRFSGSLRLPHRTLSVACHYFHSFFREYSFERYNKWDVAVASLCLASKVEDVGMSMETVIRTYWPQIHPNTALTAPALTKYREELMRLEAALLHEGKFAVVVQDPFEMLAL